MSTIRLVCACLCVPAALTLLAGCSPSAEPATSAAQPQSVAAHERYTTSWMAPAAATGNLLYVSYPESDVVLVFSYPEGEQVGELAGLQAQPEGLCSDARGDVWVTLPGAIYEYAHAGTTPIAKLQDGTLNAWACSVDPSSGDLAVVSPAAPSGDFGDVAIYKHARGSPVRHKDGLFLFYFGCGYDPSGNLYVLGFGYGSYPPVLFAELPKGESKLETIALSHAPQGEGDVQWDGQDVAVSSPPEQTIYRFRIKGKLGHEVGYTVLDEFSTVQQFVFPNLAARHGKMAARVIGGSTDFDGALLWDYPQGGDPTRDIGSGGDALGVTVSIAPK